MEVSALTFADGLSGPVGRPSEWEQNPDGWAIATLHRPDGRLPPPTVLILILQTLPTIRWRDIGDNDAVAVADARKQLYAIIRQDVPFQQKAREALDLGKQFLDVENGHLTRIDQDTQHWEAIASTDPPEGQFPEGLELGLGGTYCRRTVESDSQIALHDAANQGWADDPAFEAHGLSCYLGTPMTVNGQPYGTVCFVSNASREPFSDSELLFAELIAVLLERELEREQHEIDLTRQTNLANVLNRVLRHNLRNDISIIRGYTQMMAEELGDTSHSSIALTKIDKLINLADKARQLDRTIASGIEREPTDIIALIEQVVETEQQKHPNAAFAIEYDEPVTTAVASSFEKSVTELIENAVTHGGVAPNVTIAVELVPNALEIQIRDDGPGLEQHEADVLERGTETPLLHGSGLGLWLAHWIVTSHGGTVDATVTDAGTTMTISIPRNPTSDTQQRLGKLRRSHDRYQAAFESAKDAMIILNDEGRVLEANPEASAIYGMGHHRLLGQPISRFFPADFDFETAWANFNSSGDERDTVTVVGADGVERTVSYTATTNVVPGQHLVISRDISERAEREHELQSLKNRYETLLEEAPDPAFVADAETGSIIEVNSSAETLLGTSRAEIIGLQYHELHPESQADQYRRLFQDHVDRAIPQRQLPDGTPIVLERNDGRQIPVEINVTNIPVPGGTVLFGIFRDISAVEENQSGSA